MVRVSAGPGVLAEGIGGRLALSRWIEESIRAERGSVEAEINSSSVGITSAETGCVVAVSVRGG